MRPGDDAPVPAPPVKDRLRRAVVRFLRITQALAIKRLASPGGERLRRDLTGGKFQRVCRRKFPAFGMEEPPGNFLLLRFALQGRGLRLDGPAHAFPLSGTQRVFGGLEASGILLAFVVGGVRECIEVEDDPGMQFRGRAILIERAAWAISAPAT